MTIIKNARILIGDGRVIENGVIAFDEKIRYVGKAYDGAADETIDASGLTVTPGLIDANCHV